MIDGVKIADDGESILIAPGDIPTIGERIVKAFAYIDTNTDSEIDRKAIASVVLVALGVAEPAEVRERIGSTGGRLGWRDDRDAA